MIPTVDQTKPNYDNCFIVAGSFIKPLTDPTLNWVEINAKNKATLVVPLARLSKPGAYVNDREYLSGLTVFEIKRADSNGMVTVVLFPRNPLTTGLTMRDCIARFLSPTTTPPLVLPEPVLSFHMTVSDNRLLEMTANVFMPVSGLRNPERIVRWTDDTLNFARSYASGAALAHPLNGVYEAAHLADIQRYYTFRSSKQVPLATLRDNTSDILEVTDHYCGIKFEADNKRIPILCQRLHTLLTNPTPTEA